MSQSTPPTRAKLRMATPPPLVRKQALASTRSAPINRVATPPPRSVTPPLAAVEVSPDSVAPTVTPLPETLDGLPRIAVIGTAGRAEKNEMTRQLWEAMTAHFRTLLADGTLAVDHLVSGGAAWSDHVAVWAFNEGLVGGLTLCLPAPFDVEKNAFYQAKTFEQSAASAANYHQRNFSKKIEEDTLGQIRKAIDDGAQVYAQPHQLGYSAMFARNDDIARLATGGVVAFSFGDGAPNSKGTRHTWDRVSAEPKININLGRLINENKS